MNAAGPAHQEGTAHQPATRPRAVLVGLPGVGKSSVGIRLASRLSLPFADSDWLVEQAAGRDVAEIFATEGEAGFREREAAAVLDALSGFGGVLALGGGAVTVERVRQGLAEAAVPVVLLTAAEPELLRRLGRSPNSRPLLAGDLAGRLATLTVERAELYRQVCTFSVDTAGRSVAAVAELVLRELTRG